MRRISLLLTIVTVSGLTACGTAPGVPQWKDGVALPASPSAAGREPAAGAAAGSPIPQATATPEPDRAPEPNRALEPDPVATTGAARSPEGFTAAVRGRLPEVAVDRRPEEITEMGDAACAELVTGQRRGTATDKIIEYGVTAPEARELVRLARTFLCPG